MATVTRPAKSLPDPGDPLDAEPIRDHINNIMSFLEATNIDEANVDLTGTDGIVGKSTSQTITGLKTLENIGTAGQGVLVGLKMGLNPASGTPAANDGVRFGVHADDAGGGVSDLAFLDFVMTTATAGAEVGRVDIYVAAGAGSAVSQVQITDGAFVPTTTDDISLGTSALNFSDLFLDSGAVINFDSGDVTATHSANTLTIAGGTLATAALTSTTFTALGAVTVGADGTGHDVVFHSATSGDNLTWDASEEVLQITGTDGQTALDVLDGDMKVVDKLYFYDRGGEYLSSDGSILTITGAISTSSTLATTGEATLASLVCTAGGTFGGGYGDTGVTISTAGVIQANGAITSDGAVTGATLAGTISTATQNSITTATSLASVGTITTGTWSGVIDGSCTMTLGSDATGDIYYRDASGFLERLASGADGDVLTGTGVGSIPAWEAIPGGATLTGSTNNTITTVTGANAFQGEANLTFDGTTLDVVGNAGVGIARTDGTFHVNTASAGAIAFDGNLDDLIIENSGHGGLTVAVPDASLGYLGWQSPSSTAGHNQFTWSYNSGVEQIVAYCAGGGIMSWNAGGLVGINETVDAGVTTGLTINQGANDDEIFALKSSDVAHGITDYTETDTYARFLKLDANAGGLRVDTFVEGTTSNAIQFRAITDSTTYDTTQNSGGYGLFEIIGLVSDGGTGAAGMNAAGNIFSIHNGSSRVFIINEDGDFFHDGTGTAFDLFEDAPLIRTFALETSDPAQVVRSKWDDMVKYDKQSLVDAGLLGYVSDEDASKGIRPLVCGSQMQRALIGESWQGYCRDMELKEELDELKSKNALLEQRLNLLNTNLNLMLEN